MHVKGRHDDIAGLEKPFKFFRLLDFDIQRPDTKLRLRNSWRIPRTFFPATSFYSHMCT